jgi:enediyne biosynthesis protein E5
MTTEPAAIATSGAAAIPQGQAKAKPKFDQRFVAPLMISVILLAAHFTAGVLVSPWKTGLAILSALVVELVLGRIFYGKWPHLASAYVTGISVGILLRAETFYWPYAFCSAISIISKYVIRVENRHIWNPSNFGIAATILVAPFAAHTLSQEFDNSIWPMLVIWVLGALIIARLKRFHICATYVASFLVLALIRSRITGHEPLAEIAPITGPMYQLFTFFMITDPKTTVHSKKGQIAVAFCVALMEHLLRLSGNSGVPLVQHIAIHAPYFALFIVGPIANMIEIWSTGRRKASAPAA